MLKQSTVLVALLVLASIVCSCVSRISDLPRGIRSGDFQLEAAIVRAFLAANPSKNIPIILDVEQKAFEEVIELSNDSINMLYLKTEALGGDRRYIANPGVQKKALHFCIKEVVRGNDITKLKLQTKERIDAVVTAVAYVSRDRYVGYFFLLKKVDGAWTVIESVKIIS